MLPTRLIEGRDAVLELGGLKLELRQRGAAHTPGHASRTYLEMERE